ncbi:hypothetical protein CD351_04445 [Erythrobacter sp. KY5]|nr:hypothetical protein CD351_04445 [Erythrobacter sp. KY5]
MALARPLRMAQILGWRLLRKRKRARTQLERAIAGLPFAQHRWNKEAGVADTELVVETSHAGRSSLMAVHLHVSSGYSRKEIAAAVQSALKQSVESAGIFVTQGSGAAYEMSPNPEITLIQGIYQTRLEAISACIALAKRRGIQWLVPFDPSSRLSRYSLASYSAHLLRQEQARNAPVLYGDEIGLGRLRATPAMWLKPDWDGRMALSQDYLSSACALAIEPASQLLLGDETQLPHSLFELVLRLCEGSAASHVGRVTSHTEPEAWREKGGETLDAVRRVTRSKAETVEAGPFGTVKVIYETPTPLPKVSVVVATRDRVELLRTCVDGVLHATNYANLELVVADNESVEPETLDYMETIANDPRVKVVRWPHPFNYSAINNFAVRQSSGEYICLLNNDIEVLEPNWLMAMMREAVRPGVGAVGARLLYPDRTIQHAGVAIGIGNAAGHAHRGLPEKEPGFFAQTLIARGASAVTAACLVVARQHFDSVGGLDESELAVAYNDVDFCLKLRAKGLQNIYSPEATLIHYESKSRGLDFAPEHLDRYLKELAAFQKRWSTMRVVDPWHHPRFDRSSEIYCV